MRIAVPENKDGQIVKYFEEITTFSLYEWDGSEWNRYDDILQEKENDFAESLKANRVELLICGSMDHHAEAAIRKAGIKLIRDANGYSKDILLAWQYGYISHEEKPRCGNSDKVK